MGNRAVITTSKKDLGIYVHWNGGRDSVEGFLKYCELKGYTSPEKDCYGWARLTQVIANFFGGTNSVGIDSYLSLDRDNYDNGVYIIENWQIVGREYQRCSEQQEYKLEEMLKEIDERQPESEQLGEYLTATEVETASLKVGDIVFVDYRDKFVPTEIIGIGDEPNGWVNGTKTFGLPYIGLYGSDPKNNCNNYIRTKTAKIKL